MPATTIGTFEAKTHFSALIERVEHGESITITKHGREVAEIIPKGDFDREKARLAIASWRDMRKNITLGQDLTWKDLRDEGRKW